VLGRRARTTVVEGPRLLREQVRSVDAGVEPGDGGEPEALLVSGFSGALSSARRKPFRTAASAVHLALAGRRGLESVPISGLVAIT